MGTGIAVYVPERKAIHVLNSTAHLLFELLAEPATESELRLALAMATGSNPPSIAGDVSEALAGFIDLGIVEPEAQ